MVRACPVCPYLREQFLCVHSLVQNGGRERELSIIKVDEEKTHSGASYAVAETGISDRSVEYIRGLESRSDGETWTEILQESLSTALCLTLYFLTASLVIVAGGWSG